VPQNDPLQYLADNAYLVIFVSVLAEQIGVPVPSAPVLVAAGALVAQGRVSLAGILGVGLVAALIADSLWYALGRRFGTPVLHFLCRFALEPDSCVRSTHNGFVKHGSWLLILAKFVPGLETAAPPLAGISGIGVRRFVLFDSAGILLQILAVVGIGYAFSGPLGRFATRLPGVHGGLALVLVVTLLGYIGWKYARRRRGRRDLRIARIGPAELKAAIDAGEPVVIIDLRHPLEDDAGAPTVPGAIRMLPEELEERAAEIPPDRDVVLYCT
jgi:membrane protein DedA with SNARE-associated domain